MNLIQQRPLDFLKQEFGVDGSVHFLAVAAVEQQYDSPCFETPYKLRLALTFQDGSDVNPYFDGTDMFVTATSEDIHFTQEEEWAEGPPIRDGSPIELAVGWVIELAPPFFVSPEAQEAANRESNATTYLPQLMPPTDPNPWF